MVSLRELEALIDQLSDAEKVQLSQRIASELSHTVSGIESTPGVAGGAARIVNTRIPVWVLVQARRLGASEADLLYNYPTLRAEDLVNAWTYARRYPQEIDREIVENETA
jgi:uncharacterized protein (DUF433 family)